MSRRPFIWQDIEHWTIPDFMDTLQLVDEAKDAKDFMEAFSEVCDHAEHSVGYIARLVGDKDSEEGERICETFGVTYQEQAKQLFTNSSCGILDKTPERV